MARINEHEIFASYIGEKVNEHRLGPISRHNGNGYGDYADSKEYIISHVDYYDVKEYREVFGLTSVLTERWDYKGIDFRIYIYIRDGVITGGHVFKYITISESCHFRPIGYETDATQQELCVVERILAYITKEEINHEYKNNETNYEERMLTPEEGHKMMQDVEEAVERYRQYVVKRRKEEAKARKEVKNFNE